MPFARDNSKRAPVMASDSERHTQRLTQFSKTKMCKFHMLGMCAKGMACQFAHGDREMRPLPDLRNTKLCTLMIKTGKCGREDCNFAHTRDQLRHGSMPKQSRVEPAGKRAQLSDSDDFAQAQNLYVRDITKVYDLPPGFENFAYFGEEEDSETWTPDSTAPTSGTGTAVGSPRFVTVKAPTRVRTWSPLEPAYIQTAKETGLESPCSLPLPVHVQVPLCWTKDLGAWSSESTFNGSNIGDTVDSMTSDSPVDGSITSALSMPMFLPLPVPIRA